MPKMKRSCGEVSRILKALSHPNRLLVLGYLLEGPKTVGQLVSLCGTSQSLMSQFLIRMTMENLVRAEKRGKFKVYSLADKRLARLLRAIQGAYCQ